MLERGDLRHSQALELLADASRLLASSLELSATLPRVAQLCVERLGDYCVIAGKDRSDEDFFYEAGQGKKLRLRRGDRAQIETGLRSRGFQSVLLTPLPGRHSGAGVFVLADKEAGRFDDAAGEIAEILGLQLTNAPDQATRLERTHPLADRL